MKPGPKKGTRFVEVRKEKFCLCCNPEILGKMKAYAEKKGRSLSGVVEDMFGAYLDGEVLAEMSGEDQ